MIGSETVFVDDAKSWLPHHVILACQRTEPLFIDKAGRLHGYYRFGDEVSGDFYVGVDLGKHIDNNVIMVVKRKAERWSLVFCREERAILHSRPIP